RHHRDASGLAKALACNRHLFTSPAFVRRDLLDLGPLHGAVLALLHARRFGRLRLRTLYPSPRVCNSRCIPTDLGTLAFLLYPSPWLRLRRFRSTDLTALAFLMLLGLFGSRSQAYLAGEGKRSQENDRSTHKRRPRPHWPPPLRLQTYPLFQSPHSESARILRLQKKTSQSRAQNIPFNDQAG